MHYSDTAYTRTAIGLHWIIFVTIAAGWALGQYMTGLPFSPQKLRYVAWHKWIGVTAFLLTALRLAWRAFHAPPALPASMTAFEQRAAASMHALLYVLVVVIPLSGWLFSSALGVPTVYLGLVQLPDLLQKDKALAQTLRQVHATLNWTLLAAISLHALAALKHQFIDRDTVLARMLPHLKRCR
jgi:cytochrome b561